jgi:hypothetical protein
MDEVQKTQYLKCLNHMELTYTEQTSQVDGGKGYILSM